MPSGRLLSPPDAADLFAYSVYVLALLGLWSSCCATFGALTQYEKLLRLLAVGIGVTRGVISFRPNHISQQETPANHEVFMDFASCNGI